ncbi:MAG: PDZ domain-containing protein [Nocardioidaceae bacterium]|nr:PDZ domain-containing protein [Nocardioidaceae bacterium]
MSQRLIAACIAGPLALILAGVALAVPLPYGSYSPGPTFDILGKDANQAELVQVDGHKAYYDKGQIRFTTVLASGYDDRLSLGTAVFGWLNRDEAVVPYNIVHPPNVSKADENAEGAVQMTTSQDVATAVAMTELGLDVPEAVQVALVEKDGPASKSLLLRDIFLKIDDKPVTSSQDVIDGVQNHEGPGPVEFTILRDGKEKIVRVVPKVEKGKKKKIGVYLGLGYEFPFKVKLRVDPNVGGPSAGLMFSLAIYDTLTPGSLTGGEVVAGTGELGPNGQVGPIGGIQQKIAGAQKAGAKLFFVPKDNCPDVKDLDPDLRLVKATTMHEARVALQKWSKDRDATLPAC